MSTPSMWQGVARVGVAEAAADISAFADGEKKTKCTRRYCRRFTGTLCVSIQLTLSHIKLRE